MSTRLRVVGWTVQPQVMSDDGDNLVPLEVDPVVVPAARWAEFVDGGWERSIDSLREQVETTDDPE